MTQGNDYPFNDVVDTAGDLINRGYTVYQKFTCEKCGQRLTMDEPNKFFISGTCDKCGHETDIQKHGCNYMVHAVL